MTALLRYLHPAAGALAIFIIASFWLATVLSEVFASSTTVSAVKTAICWGLLFFLPVMIAAGGTGFVLSKGRRTGLIGTKLKRMRIIAANGILILVPAAIFLASSARAAQFDAVFYSVQALELAAGALNIALMALNMRDGLRMRRRIGERSS